MTPGDSLPALRRIGKMLFAAEYIVSSVPRIALVPGVLGLVDRLQHAVDLVGLEQHAGVQEQRSPECPRRWRTSRPDCPTRPTSWRMRVLTLRGQSLPDRRVGQRRAGRGSCGCRRRRAPCGRRAWPGAPAPRRTPAPGWDTARSPGSGPSLPTRSPARGTFRPATGRDRDTAGEDAGAVRRSARHELRQIHFAVVVFFAVTLVTERGRGRCEIAAVLEQRVIP